MAMQITPDLLKFDEFGEPMLHCRLYLTPVLPELRRYPFHAEGLVDVLFGLRGDEGVVLAAEESILIELVSELNADCTELDVMVL
jgi:hypothetical protein